MTTKVYNEEKQVWEIVSSSDANQINVASEKLVGEGESSTNVEAVLNDMHDDISLLKGNVAWLALHGGGGSGGGTGGGGNVAGNITVNGQMTNSTVACDDTNGLYILVQASAANLKWLITVSSGSSVIKTLQKGTVLTVTRRDLKAAGIEKTAPLTITAYNDDTLATLYWNGTVSLATVAISTLETLTYSFIELLDLSIVYNYELGVAGPYSLFMNGVQVFNGTLSNLEGSITVNLADVSFITVGNNEILAVLQSVNNDTVKGSCTSYIVVTTTDPIITCNSLSTNRNLPTELLLYSGAISISTPFAVYYSGTSFRYKIEIDGVASEFQASYYEYNTVYSNMSYSYENAEISALVHTLTITIRDSINQNEYSAHYYFRLVEPASNLLTNLKADKTVFAFCTYTGQINSGVWRNSGYSINIQNINVYSSTFRNEDKSLRFQNASYGYIPMTLDQINKLTVGGKTQFTLELCYKADYHPDDDRTILQWCDLGTTNLCSSGIMVRAHDLYIGQNKIMSLEDRELINIAITYLSLGGNAGLAFVYIDGVIEGVANCTAELILPSNNRNIYIGMSKNLYGDEINYTDMNLFDLRLYSYCLSPYDILFDYLNNEARTHLLDDGSPDTSYVTRGLLRNFISTDPDTGNIDSSILYTNASTESFNNNDDDILSKNFSVGYFVSTVNGNTSLSNLITNYSLPIPILFLDLSQSTDWTWTNFITPRTNTTKLPTVQAKFQYYDLTLLGTSLGDTYTVEVEQLGTSTLADYIKNLNVTFPDGVLFSPKETWFPELTYTLKADIVDSSHSLNTSIGKFVNTEFGLDDTNANFYPFSSTVKSTFVAEKNKATSAISKYFPKATLKHGVEGFPIFVIIRFYNSDPNVVDVHSLGIYQMILGRESPRNLGYEVVTGLTKTDPTDTNDIVITYPMLRLDLTLSTKTILGYWFEFGENNSFADDLNFQQLETTGKPKFLDTKFTGAFWLRSKNYYDKYIDIKFLNLGNASVSNPSDFEPFMSFVNTILALPVTYKRSSSSQGMQRATYVGTYPEYDYITKTITDADGNLTEYLDWEATGMNVSIAARGDNTASLINKLDLECICKAFNIFMLFGLIDNFMKNLPIKFYLGTDGQWEKPLLGIYDTDSGLGLNNQAEINIDEAMWLCGLSNSGNHLVESKIGANSTVVATSNKLWMFDSNNVNYALNETLEDGSLYATNWAAMLNYFNTKKNVAPDLLAEYYYNNYFLPQTEGCGELLFNLTYIAKYITKYQASATSTSKTNQIGKLHGRRRYQIKRWLKNRITFLNSWYNAIGMTNSTNTIPSSSIAINAAIGPALGVVTNTPVAMAYSNQGSRSSYIFCNSNTLLDIYFGAGSLDTSDYAKSHVLSNPETIILLGSGANPLYNIGFNSINTGELPYLITYDVSAPSRSSANKNGLGAMDSAYMYSKFCQNGVSELRTIDFRNTYPKVGVNSYILNLRVGFEKLQNLYINDSCITGVTFPENISLRDFNVSGSNLINLNVSNQSFITELDVNGCTELQTLNVTNCDNLKSISLGSSNKSLYSVTISSNSLEDFTLVDNDSVVEVTLISDNLKDVTITNCKSLRTVNVKVDALENLDLHTNISFDTLNFTGSDYSSLKTLDISNTKISETKFNTISSGLIDLSVFTSLTSVNASKNTEVLYIRFANVKDNPVPITKSFEGCTKLTRVYGNLSIACQKAFYNCNLFSIHGSNLADVRFKGFEVVDSTGKVKMPYEAIGATKDTIIDFYQEGVDVTNLTFNVSNVQYAFYATNCTLFDVYYALSNIGSATNCIWMFYNLRLKLFNCTSTCDNSPHRYMFYKCGNVTTVSGMFYGSCSASGFRIYTPTGRSGENVTTDDGLFSPLVKCLTISTLFYNAAYFTDRFVFRRVGNSNYAFTNGGLNFFRPVLFVDNVNTSSFIDYGANGNEAVLNYITAHLESCGNTSNLLRSCLSVKYYYCFLDREGSYLDYDKHLTFPSGTYYLYSSLCSTYAKGTMAELGNFLDGPATIQSVYQSFRVTSALTIGVNTYKLDLPITSDFFKGCTNLRLVGYTGTQDNYGYVNLTLTDTSTSSTASGETTFAVSFKTSFNGDGINKYINLETFPFDIISKCTFLLQFSGFFSNCAKGTMTETPALPGNLFSNNSNITDTSALFYNADFNFTLSSPDDYDNFKKCSKLSKVTLMFGYNDANHAKAGKQGNGSIPLGFFSHGFTTVNKTYYGINGTINGGVTTNDGENKLILTLTITLSSGVTYQKITTTLILGEDVITEVKYKNQMGNEVSPGDIYSSQSITYLEPNKTITNMDGVFLGNNFTYFENTSPEAENNSEWQPFDYLYSNGEWVKTTKNTQRQTIDWVYDGVHNPSSLPTLDEDIDTVQTSARGNKSLGGINIANHLNFCCPPDLFRYSTNSCSINYVFGYSGRPATYQYALEVLTNGDFGLLGRICPYLLKPLSALTSAIGIFANCKKLSYYVGTDDYSYIIPPSFFTYAPKITNLANAFRGMIFPRNVNLAVFSHLPSLLNISYIFHYSYFMYESSTSYSTVGPIFTNSNLSNISCAFDFNLTSGASTNNGVAECYVGFNQVFAANKFNASYPYSKCHHVFAGQGSAYSKFENKVLPDNTTTYNYFCK